MRIAVTGSTGFVGRHLAAAIVRAGHSLIGLVRAPAPPDFLAALGGETRLVTLTHVDQVRAALQGADVVVHAAAKIYGRGRGSEFTENPRLTRCVLDAAIAAGIPHFVHLSTVGIYGFPRGRSTPFLETDGHGPIHRWNLYSRSKVESEKIVFAAQQAGRIAVTVLRPTWITGPGDTALMGRRIDVLRWRRYTWIGTGQNRISLIDVSDAVAAVVCASTQAVAAGQTYNIAADEFAPTQEEFITQICRRMDLPLPTKRVAYSSAYAAGLLAECLAHLSANRIVLPVTRLSVLAVGGQRGFSSDKLRRDLGWQPQVTFTESIGRTTEWFRTAAAAQGLVKLTK